MNLRWWRLQLLAILALWYAMSGDPVAGIDTVYVVGAVGVAILVGTVAYHGVEGYRSS